MIDPRMVEGLLASVAYGDGCPVCGARWHGPRGHRQLQHYPDCELVEILFIHDL